MSKDKPKGGLGKGLDILFGDTNMNIDSEKNEPIHENVTELNPKSEESILFISLAFFIMHITNIVLIANSLRTEMTLLNVAIINGNINIAKKPIFHII